MKKNKGILINVISIALGGFVFGYDIAMISGTTTQLEELFGLSKFALGFTVAIFVIGTIAGTMVIGKPADKYGRRRILQLLSGLLLIAVIGATFSVNWYMLLFFRLATGFLMGGVSVVTPMFIAEISPAAKRGSLVLLNQFGVVTAIFLAFVVNYIIAGAIEEGSWRWMIGVEMIPITLFFLALIRVPDSPRWLVMQNRLEDGKRVFEHFGVEDPEKEIQIIVESMKLETHSKGAKLFTRENRFPIMAAVLIAAFNQLAGINAIMQYAPRIFEMTGLTENVAMLQSISIGLTNFLFTFLAIFLIDRVGRRVLLMVGSVGMVFFLGMISRAFFLQSFTGYSVMVYLIGFIAFFAFSQGAVIWVFISEIFPNKVRAKGQALGAFTHWVMFAAISWTFPVVALSPKIGGGPSFAFFAVMMVLHFLFAWKVIPETKGKSLEKIQEELAERRNKASKK
jgi:sugar porter (SP) family MFS transporter